jgi:PAS domain S-box-containing protein/putative nucleotidyltransferase with HDIG domain
VDSEGRFVRWSGCWDSTLGYEDVGLEGASLLDLIDPGDADAVLHALSAPITGDGALTVVAKSRRRDGSSVWFEWRFLRRSDDEVYVSAHDITERRTSADTVTALRLLEDEAEQTAHLGSWRLDLSDGSLTWSPEMYRLFGVDPSDGLDLDAVTNSAIHPDDRDAIAAINRSVLANGQPVPATYRICRPDGSVLWAHAQGLQVRGDDGHPVALVGFVQDITERKLAEDALAGSERFSQRMLDTTPNLIYIYDVVENRNIYTNREITDFLGYTSEEVVALGPALFEHILHPDDAASVTDHHARMNALAPGDDRVFEIDYRMKRADGEWRWLHSRDVPFARDESGAVTQILGSTEDVTERLAAAARLSASETRYRAIIDGMQDAYFRAGNDGRLTLANQAAAAMFGFASPSEMLGIDAGSFYADVEERLDVVDQLRRDGYVADRVGQGRKSDGSTFWVSLNVGLAWNEDGVPSGTEGFARDVTDRVLAQQAREQSMSMLRATLESTADGILVVDLDGNVASYNQRFVELWDIPGDRLAAQDDATLLDFVAAQLASPEAFMEKVIHLYAHPDEESFESLHFADGRVVERYSRPQMIGDVVVGRVWSFRDVTTRAKAERALRVSEEDLREAQAIARIGSYVYDIVSNGWTSSETMDDIFGIDETYVRDFAGWAGLVQADDRGMMIDYFANDVVAQGLTFDKEYRVTRQDDGRTVWVHGHGRLEHDGEGRPIRLIGAIQDVTQRHRGEKALRETNASLERMVYEVAEAMGRVIEIRDQYTKGHQERTARLAKAIATEMGMGGHDITAVEMAAVVHDIGKLSVPAEILTRPTLLTDLEMSLVREHPHNGYEILKDIPFPWPVADIVLQHHERMDGSGYPAGLRGDEIVPLARVLTVADVVEAMATHRPYRAALGLDAAIAELRQFPEKYDAATVEACMRLYDRGEIEL